MYTCELFKWNLLYTLFSLAGFMTSHCYLCCRVLFLSSSERTRSWITCDRLISRTFCVFIAFLSPHVSRLFPLNHHFKIMYIFSSPSCFKRCFFPSFIHFHLTLPFLVLLSGPHFFPSSVFFLAAFLCHLLHETYQHSHIPPLLPPLPCIMNEPNRINSEKRAGMPCLRDRWINYYRVAVTRLATEWRRERWRAEGRERCHAMG